MNIILVSFECFPFASPTSLGEIVSSLAYELENHGHKVTIFTPRYGFIDPQSSHIERIPIDLKITINSRSYNASIFKGILPKSLISVFFIESQFHFSNLKEIYPEDSTEEEFLNKCLFFATTTVESIIKLKRSPDILHTFNAAGCYLPKILNSRLPEYKEFHETKTVFSILDLDFIKTYSSVSKIMNETITSSNLITTVSSSFKEELLTNKHETNLEESLLKKQRLFAATPFYTLDRIYNPEIANDIAQTYTKKFFTIGKKKCKEQLLENFNFENNAPVPLIGTAINKRKDIVLLKNLIVKTNPSEISFVVLLNKNEAEENKLPEFDQYKNVKLVNSLDNSYAKKLYAGCDFFFCFDNFPVNGFQTLSAMQYGCIPIVLYQEDLCKFIKAKTKEEEEIPCIFFNDVTQNSVTNALHEANKLYKNKEKWAKLVKQAMNITEEFSCADYLKLYESLSLQDSLCGVKHI